jgi:uncharacterized protein YnzC (UPF0291/DUF896 family)
MPQSLTLTLPDSVLQKLNNAARLTHRSMDEIVAATVDAALTSNADLPSELQAELAAMHLFSDDALWAATNPSMSAYEQQRLAQLNESAKERSLTSAQEREQQTLISAYQRSILRRAQALAILKQRGHDITPALQPLQGS